MGSQKYTKTVQSQECAGRRGRGRPAASSCLSQNTASPSAPLQEGAYAARLPGRPHSPPARGVPSEARFAADRAALMPPDGRPTDRPRSNCERESRPRPGARGSSPGNHPEEPCPWSGPAPPCPSPGLRRPPETRTPGAEAGAAGDGSLSRFPLPGKQPLLPTCLPIGREHPLPAPVR